MTGTIFFDIVCLIVAYLANREMNRVPGYSNPKEFHTNVNNYGIFGMIKFFALAFAGVVTLVKIADSFGVFDR